jgi:hypothetical protein
VYAKLSSTITRSSIWREPPATRVVWIALLALANKDGFVKGVEAWLASEANVERSECREALETFMSPDPESQDQDYGGRRLEKVEGGWLVLNYKKYRDMRTTEQVLAAERQQRKRKRDKGLDDSGDVGVEEVTACHVTSRDVTTIVSASASAPAVVSASAPKPRARARSAAVEREPAPDEAAGSAPPRPAGGAQTAGAAQTGSPPLFDRFQHASHRDAYAAMRSAHRLPAALDAALRDIAEPVNGGPAYTWDEIGGALLQVLGNGETFNAARCRGYCRSIRAALVSQGHTPRPSARGAATAVSPATAEIGGTAWSAADVWDLCVRSGLASPMQSREALEERVRTLKADGKIHDEDAFLSLVLHVQPWALAEIRFDRTREERLAAAVATWTPATEAAR